MPGKEQSQISLRELPFNFIFEAKIKSSDSHWVPTVYKEICTNTQVPGSVLVSWAGHHREILSFRDNRHHISYMLSNPRTSDLKPLNPLGLFILFNCFGFVHFDFSSWTKEARATGAILLSCGAWELSQHLFSEVKHFNWLLQTYFDIASSEPCDG